MKSKVLKKIILTITLLFSIFPIINVNAASQKLYSSSLTDLGFDKDNGTYYIGPKKTSYKIENMWYWHGIYDGKETWYAAYCLNPGLGAPENGGSINKGTDNLGLNDAQISLLKNIIASGYSYSNKNKNNLKNNIINSLDNTKKEIATQMLVWEVMTGGRTNYNTKPNNESKNSYSFIKKHGIEEIYKSILSNAKKISDTPETFGTYTLHWSDSKSKYVLSNPVNVDVFKIDTEKTDSLLTTTQSKEYVSVSSNKKFSGTKNVSLYKVFGSTAYNDFRWFKFSTNNAYCNQYGCQDFALAVYGIKKTSKFSVKVEEGSFVLAKYDDNKKLLKGAEFQMFKCESEKKCESNPTNSINLTKDAYKEITIDKSGLYLFKETKVPYGYEQLDEFFVNFTIDDNGKVKATAQGSYPFLKIDGNNTLKLQLNVTNESKNFKINKVDKDGKEIKGASFKIKDSKNNYVKFVEKNGAYEYSKEGTIDTIKNDNLSSYTISLLPKDEYVLEEVNVPYPYMLSSKQIDRETKFKIDEKADLWEYNYETNKYVKSTTVSITVKNFTTKVKLIKTGLAGKKLEGVTFELYDSSKTKQIVVKTMANGEYEYNRDSQTSPIQLVTNQKGEIIINYLPEGSYWLKEVKTVDEYVIDPAVEWTNFKVVIGRNDATYNLVLTITNAKGSFCFYKIDEDGNYLDEGKFKLQMYNEKNLKYEDVPLLLQHNNNEKDTYTIDTTYKSDVYTFSPISNGETCFTDIKAKGKYRVVEIEAPKGFILPKVSETQAELTINENGYASGSAVIINKKVNVGKGAEAQAELIINIQTGQNRIHYIIIISVLLVIITGLFILKKKIDKK